MKRLALSLALAAFSALWVPSAFAQTADEIVEKHLAALGGRAVLGKLTSQVATGTISVSTQAGDLTGPVEITRKAPNKARTLLKLDLSALGGSEMVVDQRCDGQTAFVSNSLQGDREITGNQLQGMLNASFPSPLLSYKDAGWKVELVGKDTVGGRGAVVLQVTPKAGSASRMYFDAETFMIVKSQTTVTVPEAGGDMEQSSEFSDYRDIGGTRIPFKVIVVNTAQTITMNLAKVEFNTSVDDAIFVRPTGR